MGQIGDLVPCQNLLIIDFSLLEGWQQFIEAHFTCGGLLDSITTFENLVNHPSRVCMKRGELIPSPRDLGTRTKFYFSILSHLS